MASSITHIKDLTPDPNNARRHNPRNIGLIERSLNDVGAARSIVVDEDGVVLAGNGLLEAAAQAGIERVRVVDADGGEIIAVRRSNLTAEQKTMLALYDNRTAELADWEPGVLAELAGDFDLSNLFTADELADVAMPSLPEAGAGGDEFDATPEDGPTRTQLGELWRIGGVHRLLVGDCTDPANVARLMGGERADMIFTDPPYNCADQMSESFYAGSYSPAMKELSVTGWDHEFDIQPFLSLLTSYRPENGAVYICASHTTAPAVWEWMRADKAALDGFVVWCKPNPMPSLAKRHPTWAAELICYGTWGKHVFNFPDQGHALNWWELTKNSANRDHPTEKPIAVPERAIEYSSRVGALIVDSFLGSGTTLIAAHRTGRRCYGMEISPRYADVILRRAEAEGLECKRID